MHLLTDKHPPMDLKDLCAIIKKYELLSKKEKKKAIKKIISYHVTLTLEYSFRELFRVRKIDNGEKISSFKDIIWPPENINIPGRASINGSTTMYLSSTKDTALSEARINKHRIAIARFRNLEEGTHIFPVGELHLVTERGFGELLSNEESKCILDIINACPIEKARSIIIADKFIYKVFTSKDDDNYEMTSFIVDCIFNKIPKIDTIGYRSQMREGGYNLAIRSDKFWEKWGISSVTTADAEHLVLQYYKLSRLFSVSGIYNNGDFKWEEDSSNIESHILLSPPWRPIKNNL